MGGGTLCVIGEKFVQKSACRNLSLGPHDGFACDKMQIVDNLCSY